MLELRDVCTFYGNIPALHGISLRVNEGEIVTLIGANGAGKTTTLMTICGGIQARSGEILYEGSPIQRLRPNQIVRLGISQVPEGRLIFPELTVQENLDLGAFLRSDKENIRRDMDYIFSLFPILAQRRRQRFQAHRAAVVHLNDGAQQAAALGVFINADELFPPEQAEHMSQQHQCRGGKQQ